MVAMGTMAVISLIFQSHGTCGATARNIIPEIPMIEKAMLNLNFFNTLGTSMKKFENSASFAVAPQVILISNMWARSA